MAKECIHCSSVSDDEAAYCDGCGSQQRRRPAAEKGRLQQYIAATIFLAVLALICFRFLK